MKLGIISGALFFKANDSVLAYRPMVMELNLWIYNFEQVIILGFESKATEHNGSTALHHDKIKLVTSPLFHLKSLSGLLKTVMLFPLICFRIIHLYCDSDHIHIRCPSSVGLIALMINIFFPKKRVTVKYAGNWIDNEGQPWSYKLQKFLSANRILSKNTRVFAYCSTLSATQNIVPAFTSSYFSTQKQPVRKTDSKRDTISLLFVGTLTEGKRPKYIFEIAHKLVDMGLSCDIHIAGDGPEYAALKNLARSLGLLEYTRFYGVLGENDIITLYQEVDYLILYSKSEGWPKAVTEAMWWGVVPIASRVSCLSFILDDGRRGGLVANTNEAVDYIKGLHNDPKEYVRVSRRCELWSRKYTKDDLQELIEKEL